VGVSQLEAVAFGSDGPVLACLSAPRGQLYIQGFATAVDITPRFLSLDNLEAGWAEPGLTCVGSAAEEAAERLNATALPACYAPGSAVAQLAALRWQDAPDRPAPLYLKSADAAPPRDPAPVILP
jgi:tRNA A37 threonylcarbamoyladenosine modification protein TsaB